MLTRNIQDMSDLELSDLLGRITVERERRSRARKELAWADLRTAIMDYCREFGDIEIRSNEDDEWRADIDLYSDWKEIGCIGVG